MLRKTIWAFALLSTLTIPEAMAADGQRMVDVGGVALNFIETPGASPAIVFESGGGDGATVWDNVVPSIAAATGARLIRYDRAGLGHSESDKAPYAIDRDVKQLARGLDVLGVRSCVVLVAHSYGGFVATLFAATYPDRVCGMVLIDANLAPFFTDDETAKLMQDFAAGRTRILKDNPGLVRALDAMPGTVARMRDAHLSPDLPLIDIVAERPPVESDAEIASWRAVHATFVAADPARSGITATGSGHFVMRDAPSMVIAAVTRLYAQVAKRR